MIHDKDLQRLVFNLYKGTDRSASVVFSPAYKNFSVISYTDDLTNIKNVSYALGSGEILHRPYVITGGASGTDRYEILLEDSAVTTEMSWAELSSAFPPESEGGYGRIVFDTSIAKYTYNLFEIDIEVPPGSLEEWIRENIDNAFFHEEDGVLYCSIGEVRAAILTGEEPADDDICALSEFSRRIFLSNDGVNLLQSYGEVLTLSGTIIPDYNFTYGKDYNLGDFVKVENGFGASEVVQVTEAIRVWDDTGYQLQISYQNRTNI